MGYVPGRGLPDVYGQSYENKILLVDRIDWWSAQDHLIEWTWMLPTLVHRIDSVQEGIPTNVIERDMLAVS